MGGNWFSLRLENGLVSDKVRMVAEADYEQITEHIGDIPILT